MSDSFVTQKEFDEYKKMMESKLSATKVEKVEKVEKVVKPRQASAYQEYVKKHFHEIGAKHPGITPSDTMKKVSEMWKLEKESKVPKVE